MLATAVYVPCPGMSNPQEHTQRDSCWTCAPYWERVPTCPVHGGKLRQPGKPASGLYKPLTQGYCRDCRKHYLLEP